MDKYDPNGQLNCLLKTEPQRIVKNYNARKLRKLSDKKLERERKRLWDAFTKQWDKFEREVERREIEA